MCDFFGCVIGIVFFFDFDELSVFSEMIGIEE